jgi:hypothetical protein
MRQIEISEGYMLCAICRGFIEAGDKKPACECLEEFDLEEANYN